MATKKEVSVDKYLTIGEKIYMKEENLANAIKGLLDRRECIKLDCLAKKDKLTNSIANHGIVYAVTWGCVDKAIKAELLLELFRPISDDNDTIIDNIISTALGIADGYSGDRDEQKYDIAWNIVAGLIVKRADSIGNGIDPKYYADLASECGNGASIRYYYEQVRIVRLLQKELAVLKAANEIK